MPTPTIVQIRPGVAFAPAAAASFRRAEADLGRQISTNSTYRDWVKQLLMHNAWNRYVRGQGPYPGHSMALHPDLSKHCQGLAMDSNEWVNASFNEFMAERGWIRTAASDPTERHHYEYQSWRDKHINRPASSQSIPLLKKEEDMELIYLRVVVNGKLDTGVKGVIGSVNVKFNNPGERTHFLNLWGTPEKPRNERVHITYHDVFATDLAGILAMHTR